MIPDRQVQLAEALLAADEQYLPAELLKDWEPIECLADEHCSETLLVRSRYDGRKAVAKLIKPDQSEVELWNTLFRTQQAGLPRLLKVWHENDSMCILREYIAGRSLAEIGSSRRFTEAEVTAIAVQLCDTLQHLHEMDPPVIHRDIKPENIILRDDGEILQLPEGTRVLSSEAFLNVGADKVRLNAGLESIEADAVSPETLVLVSPNCTLIDTLQSLGLHFVVE